MTNLDILPLLAVPRNVFVVCFQEYHCDVFMCGDHLWFFFFFFLLKHL